MEDLIGVFGMLIVPVDSFFSAETLKESPKLESYSDHPRALGPGRPLEIRILSAYPGILPLSQGNLLVLRVLGDFFFFSFFLVAL